MTPRLRSQRDRAIRAANTGKERGQEPVAHPHHHLIDDRPVRRCRRRVFGDHPGDPGRILGHRHDFTAALEETEDRKGRHQQRKSVEDRLPALVPWLQTQPEPQSDHGVDPGDHQHRELKPAAQRIGDEVCVQHGRVIAVVRSVERIGDACLQDVIGEEKRNREPEHELGCFGERHLEGSAQPQRPQRQTVMDCEGAVEQEAAERARPILIDDRERAVH